MKMINNKLVSAFGIGCILAFAAQAEVKVDRAPLQIATNIELGQIENGYNGLKAYTYHGQVIQRFGVSLNQVATINDRFTVKVGVGGMFFYVSPEEKSLSSSRTTQFGPGVGQAQGIYKLGELDRPWTFQFGLFPYKYNSDAKNLGEYLLRSGTYPGYLITGGWNIINSASYVASGLRINKSLWDGKIEFDGNFFLERDLEPLYDLSPSFLINFKPAPFFEFGAGVKFSHFIPAHYAKDTPSDLDNQIRNGRLLNGQTDSVIALEDSLKLPISYYTFAGTNLDGHVSLNFGSLFENELIGKNDLKLYAEVALLGVENYPYFYEKRIARMPIMAGLNLPTFKTLDLLSIEMEYRRWDFANDIFQAYDSALPIWLSGDEAKKWNKNGIKSRNYKWSIYAKKKITDGISLFAQAASDHMRTLRQGDFTPERDEITRTPSQWYYLLRLEMGI